MFPQKIFNNSAFSIEFCLKLISAGKKTFDVLIDWHKIAFTVVFSLKRRILAP